jgi:DNA invertase Pin-like site-specific DNA recombinase
MNVISYMRVSGMTQISGDGFERQGQVIESFCKANNLKLVTSFSEQGVSGTVEGMDRPIFSQAIEFILHRRECGEVKIDAIVVERMDRLARDLMVSEMLLRECRDNGIKVFSADQGACIDMASDGGDPTRVLIRQIMGALAQWEKSVLVKKLRAAKERMKAAGKKNVEGCKPYGYVGHERFVLNTLMGFHADGKNFSEITRLLNTSGLRNRSGDPFTPQNVRGVILNELKRRQ